MGGHLTKNIKIKKKRTCAASCEPLQCSSWAVLPLLYPDVGPDDRLRLDPVHKVLLLTLVRCLTSS